MGSSGQGPGFFGKLRTHGDFVSRRMAPPLRLRLDEWLQGALLRSRQELGALWLPAWLNGPLWRFALAPGVGAERACIGVMMPSLDRVDRAFPLVIALELEDAPSLAECIALEDAWFGALEALALSTLEQDFSIDVFDAALCALGGPAAARAYAYACTRVAADRSDAPCGAGWFAALNDAMDADLNGAALPPLAQAALRGCSAWWTTGAPAVDPCLAVCEGLPGGAAFAALFDGAWEARGWHAAGA